MNLSEARRYRSLVGKTGFIVGILLVAAMIDVVIARHRIEFNVMDVLPGQEEPIDGPLAEKTRMEELTYRSDSPDLKISFDETHTGFWLGGQMWRGKLLVGKELKAGKYALTVQPKDAVSDRPPLVYRVNVYGDRKSWRQSSKSYFTRYLDLSPWWVIGGSFAFLFLIGGLIYMISGRVDALMAQSGKAEVYRVRRLPNGYEMGFGLGSVHGVHPGSHLSLYDQEGGYVGHVEVLEASANDAVGFGEFNQEIRAGFWVGKD